MRSQSAINLLEYHIQTDQVNFPASFVDLLQAAIRQIYFAIFGILIFRPQRRKDLATISPDVLSIFTGDKEFIIISGSLGFSTMGKYA